MALPPAKPAAAGRWGRWRTPGRVALLLTLLGGLGVALCSHLNSRTAAYWVPWQKLPAGNKPDGLALADDDGDGDLDIWVGHEREKMLRRYRNDGAGRFVLAGRWPSSEGMQVCLADFNEDGRPDAAVASYYDARLCLHLSQGPGRWRAAQALRSPLAYDAWAGDLDSDGHADLLVANCRDSTQVFFGDGTGHFPARQYLPAGYNAMGVLAADVDGDGDRDVLLANAGNGATGHHVRLYRNQGHRRFERGADTGVSESPQRLALADVDGDGDPDLLVTAYVTNRVDLCLNDGRGHFSAPQTLPTGAQPFSLAVADFDADGHPDVLTTSAATHSLSLLRNRGGGHFAQPVAFEVGNTPTGLAVGDLDGDGEPDAVTTDYADNTLTLLRHHRPPLVWWPLAASSLLALAYTGTYQRQQRQRREHALRTELAAELHDELGSLLTRVTMRAELLEARHSSPQMLALVQESRSAAATVRDIIWSVDTTTDTVEALLDRLRDAVEAIRRDTEREVQLQLSLDPALLPTRLRPAVRQHAYLIGKEALTNALKHGARQGELAVALRMSATELLLTVENQAADHPASRHGLRSMHTRAAAIGAALAVGPQPGGRWQVQLRVPAPLAR